MIGSAVTRRLISDGYDVQVADNFWRGSRQNLFDCGRPILDFSNSLHQVNLCDLQNCIAVTKNIDLVIHLADIVAGIGFVFSNQLFVLRNNIILNSNILHAALQNNVGRFLYVGTACSYPEHLQKDINGPPLVEDDAYPASPESSYGWSKLLGEYECGLAGKTTDMQVAVLRLHNVYGPNCDLTPETSQVIPALCRKVVEFPNKPVIVWGSGAQRRAFLYVDDVVNAIVSTLAGRFNYGVIQIGPNKSYAISEIADKICAISGKDIKVEYDLSRPEGDKDRKADFSKARELLNWHPQVEIDDGLKMTYEWVKTFLSKKNFNST